MRWIYLAALTVAVSGCALPATVTVATVMANVVSYASTGKSVTDHGISIVMQSDCALLRGFEGEICLEPDPGAAFAASLAYATEPAVAPPLARQAPDRRLEGVGYLGDSAVPAG